MLPGLVLAVLVLTAGTLTWTRWLGPAALGVLSVAWFLVNGPVEGRVLVLVSPDHGLTAGDLAGVAGLLVAALRAVTLARAARRPRDRASRAGPTRAR